MPGCAGHSRCAFPHRLWHYLYCKSYHFILNIMSNNSYRCHDRQKANELKIELAAQRTKKVQNEVQQILDDREKMAFLAHLYVMWLREFQDAPGAHFEAQRANRALLALDWAMQHFARDSYDIVKRDVERIKNAEIPVDLPHEWTATQKYSAQTPVVALSLFANNEIEEKEIVRMRNKNLAPFAHMWETDGVACVLDKNDQVIKRYYYKDNWDYAELAADECARLNKEWRKEQKHD